MVKIENVSQEYTLVDKLVGIIKPGVAPDFNALADRPLERMRIANVEPTQSQINWKPRISLDEGLARTVDWYKANSKKSLK